MAAGHGPDSAGHATPAPLDEDWVESPIGDDDRRALDQLFERAVRYRSSKQYHELMLFIRDFREFAPYNAMLIHVQKPGARFAASAHRWHSEFKRRVRANAQPLVILWPMSPVAFVFDVSDTEGEPLPRSVTAPFATRGGKIGNGLASVCENARRDGVSILLQRLGSEAAGSIQTVRSDGTIQRGKQAVPLRYEMVANESLDPEARFATIAHELAHLYCGHLGTPNETWWPSRTDRSHAAKEFEAESVAFLVCARLGIDNPSETYLANYVRDASNVPDISVECVLKSAGLIENMTKRRLPARKPARSI